MRGFLQEGDLISVSCTARSGVCVEQGDGAETVWLYQELVVPAGSRVLEGGPRALLWPLQLPNLG